MFSDPEDNLADCLPDAQDKIKEISSSREFHYYCKDGYVVSVFLPVSKTESESTRERLNPILRNQGHLFDSEPIALGDSDVVLRRRKGLSFHSREIDYGRRDWKEGRSIDFFDLGRLTTLETSSQLLQKSPRTSFPRQPCGG